MARSGRGVGATTRVPLRGFAKIFSKLPTSVRSIIERSFEEAENLMDFHSRSVPNRQNRRRISGLVAVPVVTGINSIFGGAIRWERAEDPRITMYDVQIDTVNVFPNPTTLQVLEPFFSIEGLTSTRFLRVRAIRFDGRTGNWSNTVQITPAQEEAPAVFSCLFYQAYDDDPEPNIENVVPFGGERIPKFYELFDCTFPVGRDTGGMAVFGYISNRLREGRNSNIKPWDRVRFTVNGETITENYFCHWTDSSVIDSDTRGINPNTGDPLSFYAKGGYTAAFGPYTVLYPQSSRSRGHLDPKLAQSDSGAGVAWQHARSIMRPSTWARTPLSGALLTTGQRMEESQVTLGGGASSNYLRAGDFGFQIPQESTIQGIQLKVKRRQANLSPANDFDDLSTVVASSALHHLSNHLIDITRADDIKQDDEFVYVDFDGSEALASATLDNSAPATAAPIGFNVNNNRQITISQWVNLSSLPGGTGGHLFQIRRSGGAGGWDVRLLLSTNNQLFWDVFDSAGGSIRKRYDNFFTLNQWVHIAATFDGSIVGGGTTANLHLYKNGTLQTADSAVDTNPVLFGDQGQDKCVNIGAQVDSVGSLSSGLDGLISQTGVWDEVIGVNEIQEINDVGNAADLRIDFGDYISSGNLMHYWLIFPGPTDVKDESVALIDSKGLIRTDQADRPEGESWPKLTNFTGGGIPHDSVEGMGYQEYGDENDLWNGSWTPSDVNSFYFGCAIKCKNNALSFTGPAFIDHIIAKIWYTGGFYSNEVNLKVFGEAANQFYIEREVYGAVMNAVEVGGTI